MNAPEKGGEGTIEKSAKVIQVSETVIESYEQLKDEDVHEKAPDMKELFSYESIL